MRCCAAHGRHLEEGGFSSQLEFSSAYHCVEGDSKLQPNQKRMQLNECEQEALPRQGPRRELLILFPSLPQLGNNWETWAFDASLERRSGIDGLGVTWPPSPCTPSLSPFTAPLKGIRNNNLPSPQHSGKHWGVIYSVQGKDLSVLGTSVYEYS